MFPQLSLILPWDGFVAFVDLEPMANWGHACRYVLMHPETGESKAVNAQLPPPLVTDSIAGEFSIKRRLWLTQY